MKLEALSDRTWSLMAALVLGAGGFAIGAWIITSYGHNDFSHYYLSTRLFLEGRVPYGLRLDRLPQASGLTLEAGAVYGTDTPAFLVLFAPLAALGPELAYYLWALLQLTSLAAAIVLSLRLADPPLPRIGARLLAAAVVVSFSVWDHFLFSQTQLLLLALVLIAFHLSARDRHATALLAITSAGLLKLYPLALVPWFAVRAWRQKGWRPLAPAALLAAGALAVAPGMWTAFVSLGLPHVRSYVNGPYVNVSAVGTLARGLSEAAGVRFEGAALEALWAVLSTAVLGAAYVVVWTRPLRLTRQLAVLLCGLLLAVPVAWTHYLVWAIPVLVVLAADVRADPRPSRVAILATAYLLTVGAFNEMWPRLVRFAPLEETALGALSTLALVTVAAWIGSGEDPGRRQPASRAAGTSLTTRPSGR